VSHQFSWPTLAPPNAHGYLAPGIINELDRAGSKGVRLVDMGCGNGALAEVLAERGYQVTAFDASEEGVMRARTRRTSARFEVGSAYDTELSRKLGTGFAVATSLEVIEHLLFPRQLFDRARELLEPGGLLLLSTPYHGYWKNLAISMAGGWDQHFGVAHDGGHVKFFSPSTLCRMAESAGFQPVAIRGLGRVPWLWKSMLLVARRRT